MKKYLLAKQGIILNQGNTNVIVNLSHCEPDSDVYKLRILIAKALVTAQTSRRSSQRFIKGHHAFKNYFGSQA
jgi:hypothetical protein